MTDPCVGRQGEEIAAAFLEDRGYRVLDTNYRFERNEIDIVCLSPAEDGGPGAEIVFVEVKTRSGERFGSPEDAVNTDKQQRIVEAARAYLYERRLEGAPCRFDVISIFMRPSAPEIRHFEDAFWT